MRDLKCLTKQYLFYIKKKKGTFLEKEGRALRRKKEQKEISTLET